ncbi:MAG: hypothetical protein ACT4PP_10855 [Sporichthyaceae bacterium]
MSGVVVDPDGIRAAAALLRQQASYVSQMDCYVNTTCKASGAFTGPTVLSLFEGTYENAFRLVAEGLEISLQENNQLADLLEQCAQGYTDADRGSYDAFAQIAGPLGWELSTYQAAGSGQATFAPGPCVPTGVKPPSTGPEGAALLEGTPMVGATLGALDSTVAYADQYVEDHTKRLLKKVAHETVMYQGRLIYKDDLPEGAKADPPADALDRFGNKLDSHAKKLTDPLGVSRFKGALADYAVQQLDVPGGLGVERNVVDELDRRRVGGSQALVGRPEVIGYNTEVARNKAISDGIGNVTGAYDAGKAVLDLRHDPTMGVGGAIEGLNGTWDDLNAAAATRDSMEDIISGGPDSALRDIAARQASS